ncbi:MAG: hypothetical protein ACRDQU_11515 [Pseudonocardiaceae bacterium]
MLAQGMVVGHVAVDAAAAELGVSRRQVYLLRALSLDPGLVGL